MDRKQLRALEETVVDAWPAAETELLDGWLLRASGGPTQRGNSVATFETEAELELEERIARAEGWYAARARSPLFQVGPCAPAELDRALIARGYRKRGESVLALAQARQVAALTAGGGAFRTQIEAKPSAAWLELALGAGRHAAARQEFLGFVARLGSRCRFVTAFDAQGEPAATCLGITSEARLGVNAMLTAPEQRRRGAARALLHTLAQSALHEQMDELLLLVELDNQPARALYAASGFIDAYAYHYRERPAS